MESKLKKLLGAARQTKAQEEVHSTFFFVLTSLQLYT
jgi:hypothetical protein